MKRLLAALVLAGVAVGGGWAQTSKTKAAATAKKATVDAKAKAEQADVAETAMTPNELAIAQKVYLGKVPCELGVFVTLAADPNMPGYFEVTVKNQKFHMFPVVTATGATRLEDRRNGAMWLQLGNKSMLMSQKLGIRLADACVTPEQAVVQAAMDKAPPVNLLDGKPSAGMATVVTTTTTTTTATYAVSPALPASAALAAVAAVNVASAPAASAAAPAPALAASATTTTTTTTTTVAMPASAPASAASAPQ